MRQVVGRRSSQAGNMVVWGVGYVRVRQVVFITVSLVTSSP